MSTRTRATVALVALAAFVGSVAADAAPRVARIRYAEPVALPGLPSLAAAGTQKPTGAVRTSFEAFGHRFDLQLEPNDRVLRNLSSAARATLPAHAIYAGTVVGLPGSWVRLTRLGNGVQGLVFDGNELYVLAPAGAVRSQLDIPLPGLAQTSTVIYRAADVDSGLGPDFCRVLAPPASGSASAGGAPEPAYKAIFAELATNASAIASALPGKELDLALIGDTQLAAAIPGTAAEMLARLNNVDGIFSSQVGVRITSGFVKVLANNGGMTATAADQLLDQLDSYRKVTPEAASRGVAHLMTGRELDGSTVGIAYLGTLCAPQFAVSLSQTYLDTYNSSLVAAHELGHNFGAPHDGASGTACATTPQAYLMAPSINGSSTFSQCSLDQIAPRVASAACLTTPSIADAAIELANSSISAYAHQDVHVAVDVVSTGTVSVGSVVLTLRPDIFVTLVSGTVANGSCGLVGANLTCQLGSLPAGTRRQVDVVLRGSEPSTTQMTASVTAATDADSSNNFAIVALTFTAAADGSVESVDGSAFGDAGQPLHFSLVARSLGPQALEDASIVLQIPDGFAVLTAAGAATTCGTVQNVTTCPFGAIEAGGTRTVDFSVVSATPQTGLFGATIRSSNDGRAFNDVITQYVTAYPPVELRLIPDNGPQAIPLGGIATQPFTIYSSGSQPASGVTFSVTSGPEVEIASVSGTGAVCAPDVSTARTFKCTYATPIEGGGGSRQVNVQIRGLTLGTSRLDASVGSPDNQHLPGDNPSAAYVNLFVKSQVDVRLDPRPAVSGYDHTPLTAAFSITAIGATPALNVRFDLSLPANVRATAAETANGTCTVTANSVTCSIGTMVPTQNQGVAVTVVGDVPGPYSLAAHVTADGDSVPDNDSTVLDLQIITKLDAQVLPLPDGAIVKVGSTLDYTITVRAGNNPFSDASVGLYFMNQVTPISARTSQGTCEPVAQSFTCTIGALAANATMTITVTLRGASEGSAVVTANVVAPGDVDLSNNMKDGRITVQTRGNVAIQSAAASVAATVGTSFDFPRIAVSALTHSEDVRVDLTIPAAFSIDSATADSSPCSINAGNISCVFGTLEAGFSRAISIRLRPIQAGTFSTSATATATEDSDTSNNSASVTITVSKSTSSGGGGGGGGGGGLVDPQLLLMLLWLAPAAVRRARRGAG